MCGIAGIAGLKDRSELASKIKNMTGRLAHRGPDADGFFVGDEAALGHRRLSIIDLSEAANQPLYDAARRYAIILNGEIYNYKEVKASILDYPWQTDGDSEAILAAYIKHGPECLSLLNGMFAFAIWDNEKKELFVARDRLGVKPLYYSQTVDGVFVFASEIRSIFESELVARELNKPALFEYLMYQSVYAPNTIVKNVFQLPAGTYGIFSGSEFSITPFWQIEKTHNVSVATDRTSILRDVRELFAKSIERRMVSDVPVAAFLSGGIDSSAVVAMMSEVSGRPVNTFSITFDEPDFDESKHSSLVARQFGTEHSNVRLRADDFLRELPNALSAMDSPSGDGLNTYVVSKATKNAGIKVALSGLGGDELFAGYHYFRKWLDLQKGVLPKLPRAGRRLAAAALSVSGKSKLQRLADVLASENLDIANVYPRTRQVMSASIARSYGKNGHGADSLSAALNDKSKDIHNFPLLSQFTIAELLGYTQNVLLKDTDQFSMASALEVREPFFDYELVEYVLQIPDSHKLTDTPKSLLVDSLGDLLPRSIVDRKKMGFVLPFDKWMRGELRDFCNSRLHSLAELGLFNADTLLNKWREFEHGSRGVLWSELWHLVVLTDWLETNKF
jgi:asparagine synthase (glutamine-hydrolysing)